MKILAVDTALGACSAAILDGETLLAHAFEPMERGHAERLAPMVHEVMIESGIAFAALDRLAVTIGPGTFTGQRIGYSFMRGMRLALKRPLIGVSTLSAMAHAAMAETRMSIAAVFQDAKRGEVYFALVAGDRVCVPDRISSFDDALQLVLELTDNSAGLAVAGTAAPAAVEALRARGHNVVDTEVATPDALWVAILARNEPEPETVPRPLYLRPPDARLPAGAP
jgi:tRNA threonylcarbamoyladenosine biosynthesis protein TsaB